LVGQTEVPPALAGDSVLPGVNRLFFLPTGRTLPGGVSEFGSYILIAPYVGHGFDDRLMVSGGTPLLPGAIGRYWYLAPKVGIVASPRWNLAAGGILFGSLGDEPINAESFFWGVITYGGTRAAVTVGAASDLGTLSSVPDGGLTLLGGEYELLRREEESGPYSLRLIVESYWPLPGEGSPRDSSLTNLGVRFATRGVAFELVESFELENGHVSRLSHFPLFNFSFFF
jgi:hypothetical protein